MRIFVIDDLLGSSSSCSEGTESVASSSESSQGSESAGSLSNSVESLSESVAYGSCDPLFESSSSESSERRRRKNAPPPQGAHTQGLSDDDLGGLPPQ